MEKSNINSESETTMNSWTVVSSKKRRSNKTKASGCSTPVKTSQKSIDERNDLREQRGQKHAVIIGKNTAKNPHISGYNRERGQYSGYENTTANKSTQPSQGNRSESFRRSQNLGYNNGNSRYNTNNGGSQSYAHPNCTTAEFRRNTIPERDTVGSNGQKRTVIHYSLAKNSIVKLNTCENPWTSSRLDTRKPTDPNQVDVEKKIRSILNKITPESMVVLTQNIIDMQINTYSSLSKVIELLFQKAIDEPNFTPQYAHICFQMRAIEVIGEDNKTRTTFKQLILRKCQKTFEIASALEKNAKSELTKIESCNDQAMKKKLQLKYEENEKVQRKRSVGNCRFMCEMFKVSLLSSNVLEKCVRRLLNLPKEEPLECVCIILKHTGKYLNPGNTFEKLREYTSTDYKTKISSRIRFMILDTIELKNNNWVPRNAVINPKKLNEFEEEFTTVPINNQMIFKYTKSIEKPLKMYSNSNTQKVNTKASIIATKSRSYSDVLQNKINEQKSVDTNIKKREMEHCTIMKNSKTELNIDKNSCTPHFWNSKKPTDTKIVEIKDIAKKLLEIPKPEMSIKAKTQIEQTVVGPCARGDEPREIVAGRRSAAGCRPSTDGIVSASSVLLTAADRPDVRPHVVSATGDAELVVGPTVRTARDGRGGRDHGAIAASATVVESSAVECGAVGEDIVAGGATAWIYDVCRKISGWFVAQISDEHSEFEIDPGFDFDTFSCYY